MNSFLETLKQIGPARLSIMGAIVLGLLVFFVFVSLRISVPELSLLYGDLSTTDSSSIAGKLESSQIVYEVSADGEKIFVPKNQVGRARMLLAEAGLPNGGSMGYELFDASSGFGTTNFVQNINQVRALEGELARTIISLDNIRSARVHLVLPQRELFSREQRTSSASVFLGVRPGIQIEKERIVAIQSLVASAVPDLKPENVAIIDSNGNLLASKESKGVDRTAAKAEEMRLSYENQLIDKIEDQLNRIVGYGKVRATVTAEMNFDRISMNEELYDPEGQVVRSTQTTEETGLERDGAPQDVSVGNNLPGIGGGLLSGNAPSAENSRIEELVNFEISKTIRNTVREVGEVKKLSIAVLVDGRYTTNADGERVYEPRSQDEINQISALIRSAVGFNDTRGDQLEVVNLQFAEVDTNEGALDIAQFYGFDKNKLLDVVEIVTVAIMIILVVLLVLQPMVNKLLDSGVRTIRQDDGLETELLAASPLSPALTGPRNDDDGVDDDGSLINIHGVDGKVRASSLKKVEEIIDNYPKEALSVIRSWMTQE